MNVPVLEVPGYEADDVIGTLAHQAEKEGFEVYMATPDKDYGQLVTEHIFMYRPRHTGGFEKLGPQEVCEKYGLQNQSQVIDLLGLMGDSSDNIPGCKGVGEKTAVQLLQQFGSIDNLLANTDQLKGALQRKVQEQVEDIRFSRFLATIKIDVPIELNAQSLVYQEKNWDQLAPLYRDLEFNSLLKQAPNSEEKIQNSKSKIQNSKKKPEATLDLFAALESDSTP
jgi:DNA polymerase-1